MTLRSGNINLEHKYRGHQFLMPLIAFVYCIPLMFTANRVAEGLVGAVKAVSAVASFIPGVGGPLRRLIEKAYSVLDLGYGIQLLCNTVVMTGFCVLKQIVLPIIKRWWSRWTPLYNVTAGHFYYEVNGKSVLLERFSDMRTMYRVLYYTAVAIGCIVCVLSLLLTDSAIFIPFYPVFSIIVLGEICFFLDGETADELNLDEDEEEISNDGPLTDYDALMNVLSEKYKDRVLEKEMVPMSRTSQKKHDWEKELQAGDDLDRIAGTYFQASVHGGISVNADYVSATRALLHGRSVLIYNPFYRDLTQYILLPVFHHLLTHGKCLVVCGRMTNERDIEEWLQTGIKEVTNLPKLWSIEELSTRTIDDRMPDIGILSFRRLYDMETIQMNREFFDKTTMVILLEPSNLLGTGQIGLRSIVQHCEEKEKKVTYVALDRNADGLVDALSHVIRQSITDVIASPPPTGQYWRMLWTADGPGLQARILPRISHYLGVGTELGALAMHEGVTSIHWYSGSKMPLTDLRLNVEQYYVPICKYIHSPREQSEFDRRFCFHESLWQAKFTKDSFVVVEDEFCNLFEMSRTFAARIKKRGFLNILSENYLLRDYMCDNAELFTNDPKAIPSIVPDYARTERNFVLRTLMLMSAAPVTEKVLTEELALHGCDSHYPYETFRELVTKHTGVEDPRFTQTTIETLVGGTICTKFAYQADKKFVEDVFDSALKSAHYIIENEQTDTYPMGNRLMGHIEQTILPGQFFCYDGRYYQVRSISPDAGIIVRRAADHITGRVYYRQLRSYEMAVRTKSDESRDLRGIGISNCFIDYVVRTDGYLEMKSRNLLPDASLVSLDSVRPRTITYKDTMVVRFTGATPEIRFTLCVLLNELFHTLFPNEAGYLICGIGDVPEHIKSAGSYRNSVRALVPELIINDPEKDAVYFVEDSNIDLGILVAIERNLQRILEILADYLDWYLDPQRGDGSESAAGYEEGAGTETSEGAGYEEASVEEYFAGEVSEEGTSAEEVSAEEVSAQVTPVKETSAEEKPTEKKSEEDKTMASAVWGDTAVFAESNHDLDDVDGEDEEAFDSEYYDAEKMSWAQKIDYLTYGYKNVPSWLDLKGTLRYLNDHHFDDSNLHRSRKIPPEYGDGYDYDPKQPGVHYCDFCGCIMKPGTYDVLKDGRERCDVCTSTAVKSRRAFKKVYKETIEEMEKIFDIKIENKITVRMVNAKKVNDGFDTPFVPSPGMDPRVLGYATQKNGKHIVMVENGAPRLTMKQTLVHELTHIWQHENWGDFKYESLDEISVVEGMAVWTEIQYLSAIGEPDKAKRYKINRSLDTTSPYGLGMTMYLKKYRIQETRPIDAKKTPFRAKYPPV